MVIDMTAYFGSWPYWKGPVTQPDQLLSLMDENGIDRAAVCSLRGIFDDWEVGNEEVLELASAHPKRFIPFMTFGLDSFIGAVPTDLVIDLLRKYKKAGVRGLRLFPQHQGYPLNGDYRAEPVLAEAAKLGMIFMVHFRMIMNWGMAMYPVAEIAKFAGRYPQAKVVICGVNGEWEEAATAMKKHANLLLETSCLQYVGKVAFFTQEFGVERVLFGSGIPLQYPHCGLIKITKAKITDQQRRDILGGNAQRLLA